ncbi:unnamed protein product [Nyctereutes procyonoides]|uniref:(raccoon dog) hypothetical protein n=1 Tax=Nyctereutes procyonoides TaxID=34880 RepID=A0A811Z0U6_NYCPR|nr:unnamed protein product [Nyctereutes procyonoides]
MYETVAKSIKRIILKIPMTGGRIVFFFFFSEYQLQAINFQQRKESLIQDLVLLWEKMQYRFKLAGVQYRKPNQHKPASMVYYSQIPYAITSFANNHHKIVNIDLNSQHLDSLNSTRLLQERTLELDIYMDSMIIHENRIEKQSPENILFERKEPPWGLKMFSSLHLLEVLKSLAPAGIANAPFPLLLTCISNKEMYYFKIRYL